MCFSYKSYKLCSNDTLYNIAGTPVLALTGTADDHTREVIMSGLAINSDALQVFLSPNRTNLRLNVIKTTKREALSNLDWLVKLCREKQSEIPKTISFCNTMKAGVICLQTTNTQGI